MPANLKIGRSKPSFRTFVIHNFDFKGKISIQVLDKQDQIGQFYAQRAI
jgi:hypothetical protein